MIIGQGVPEIQGVTDGQTDLRIYYIDVRIFYIFKVFSIFNFLNSEFSEFSNVFEYRLGF